MPRLHTKDLDALVAAVQQCSGDFAHPAFVEQFKPLELVYDTVVNEELSPYSEEYYNQQIALYEEVSGRRLNQATGELHPVNIEPLLTAPNPLGERDVAQMSRHVRSVSTMLSLSALSGTVNVLDMGAGHGVASEVLAFAGCNVHAIDIDPLLGQLSVHRASTRGLNVKRSLLNFDDLDLLDEGFYDAAFFCQSLHHCLRPWALIAELRTKLKGNSGVIGFVGEPINNLWWKHWGLRLDDLSLFVARSNGWFESGWSLGFIGDCFRRNGFTFDIFKGGFHGEGVAIATLSEAKRQQVLSVADTLGIESHTGYLEPSPMIPSATEYIIDELKFFSVIGTKTTLCGRPAYVQTQDTGYLVYGPYIQLQAGFYEVTFLIWCDDRSTETDASGTIAIDVVHEMIGCATKELQTYSAHVPSVVSLSFQILVDAERVEFCALVKSGGTWVVSVPTLKRLL